MAKKKVSKLKVCRTTLSEVEMLLMDKKNLECKVAELEIQNLQYKRQLISSQSETLIKEKMETLRSLKENRIKFCDNIKEELKIDSEKWGYDPITGEVKS